MSVEAVLSTQVIDTTSVGRSVMTAANAAAARSAIGAGTGSGDLVAANNLSDLASAATARTNLGLGTLATQSGTFSGTSSGTNTGDQTTVSGNAGSATVLQTARTINGVSFDGSANITVTAAGSTLSDTVTVAKGGTGLTALGTALQVLRVNAGATALEYAAASGGSPGGTSGQVQFNNAGAFGGAAAVVYATSGTHIIVTAQTTGSIPICVKAVASQTANLLESQISTGSVRAKITSIGDFSNPRTASEAECFGSGANAGDWGTAIGKSATNNNGYGFAAGRNAVAGSAGVAIAANSNCLDDSIAIGYTASAPNGYSYAFGRGAATTATGQVVFVSATHLLLTGATAKFSTSTSFEAFQIDRNTTAGQTRLLLWDIDKGSLQRVSIGAADSGGTGFKVLRVPN